MAGRCRRAAAAARDHWHSDHSVRELIQAASRRRSAATGVSPASPWTRSPSDDRRGRWKLDDVLPRNRLCVRHTANLHQAHDPRCHSQVSAELCRVWSGGGRGDRNPGDGIDLLVPDVAARTTPSSKPTSDRPGQPRTTTHGAAFVDYLFPRRPGSHRPGLPRNHRVRPATDIRLSVGQANTSTKKLSIWRLP